MVRRRSAVAACQVGDAVRKLQPEAVLLTLDQVYKEPPFRETETVKLAEVESKLLTKFHGRPTKLRAGVILPPSFATLPPIRSGWSTQDGVVLPD